MEGVIRTLLSALEEKLGARVKAEDKIVAFTAEYAAYVIDRLEVGKDGKQHTSGTKEIRALYWRSSSGRSCSGR